VAVVLSGTFRLAGLQCDVTQGLDDSTGTVAVPEAVGAWCTFRALSCLHEVILQLVSDASHFGCPTMVIAEVTCVLSHLEVAALRTLGTFLHTCTRADVG